MTLPYCGALRANWQYPAMCVNSILCPIQFAFAQARTHIVAKIFMKSYSSFIYAFAIITENLSEIVQTVWCIDNGAARKPAGNPPGNHRETTTADFQQINQISCIDSTTQGWKYH